MQMYVVLNLKKSANNDTKHPILAHNQTKQNIHKKSLQLSRFLPTKACFLFITFEGGSFLIYFVLQCKVACSTTQLASTGSRQFSQLGTTATIDAATARIFNFVRIGYIHVIISEANLPLIERAMRTFAPRFVQRHSTRANKDSDTSNDLWRAWRLSLRQQTKCCKQSTQLLPLCKKYVHALWLFFLFLSLSASALCDRA